jgi:hypothetical protein
MEEQFMKRLGIVSTAALSLVLGIAAPLYAQEQHDEQKDQQEQKDKSAKPEEKRAQPEEKNAEKDKNIKQEDKKAQPEEKNAKQEEKNSQQHEQQAKSAEPAQRGRIPADRFRANFGREHTFRVTQVDYQNHRFQYGGYAFGFVDPWPANWLYTQNLYVIEIGGVYYLCNATYPGVNLTLSFAL